jgi:hypothetical protein
MMRLVANVAVKLSLTFPIVFAQTSAPAQQLPNAPGVSCYAKDIFEARMFAAIRKLNNEIVTSYSSDRAGNVLIHIQAASHWELWGFMKMSQAYCLVTAGEGRFTEGLPETMMAKVEG